MNRLPEKNSTPRTVQWIEIVDFDKLDDRVSAVTAVFGSVIGVNRGHVQWCPDDELPTEQERLAWIWLCNPTLDTEILPRAEGWFRDLIVAYRAGEMRRWWADGGRSTLK